jgi:hypothetical protein
LLSNSSPKTRHIGHKSDGLACNDDLPCKDDHALGQARAFWRGARTQPAKLTNGL